MTSEKRPTAREVLDKQIDEITCSFDFTRAAKVLRNEGWLKTRCEDLWDVEYNLRKNALKQMRDARDTVIGWLETDETMLVCNVNQYPLIATAVICRETGNTWAKMDLTAYVEGTANDGEDCSA